MQGVFPKCVAIPCDCVKGGDVRGVTERFKNVTLAGFADWWIQNQFTKSGKTPEGEFQEGIKALADLESGAFCEPTATEKAVVDCLRKVLGNGGPNPDQVQKAALPDRYLRALETWLPNDQGKDLWIYGPAGSGRTGLAVALMRARCEAKGGTGLFASVVAVGDQLQSYYNRTIGAGTRDERIGMTKDPQEIYGSLVPPDCLVLDMIDCLPKNSRVAENFVAVLMERYDANKVTIFTALSDSHDKQFKEGHPFLVCETAGQIVLNRLGASERICMVPAVTSALTRALKI